MRVSEVMHRDVVTVGTEATCAEAARVLRDRQISAVIVSGDGGPAGIVTERDLVNLMAEGSDPGSVKVRERMTTGLVTVQPSTDLDEAVHVMVERGIRHLPVVDEGALVGIIAIRDSVAGHPALRALEQERRASLQSRMADRITAFAGSMPFVYVHIVWFAVWIILGFDPYPFGLLTMIVSLEAIFLATFVMISQNRADERRQALADHQWELVQVEEKQNEQLLAQSEQILRLSTAIHDLTTGIHGSTVAGGTPA